MKTFISIITLMMSLNSFSYCTESFLKNMSEVKFDYNEIGAAAMMTFGVNFTYRAAVDIGYGPVAVVSTSLGGISFHLGKQVYTKMQVEKINKVYADLDIGYGVFLTRFMKEVDPTADQDQIRLILKEIDESGELCMKGKLERNGDVIKLPELYVPSYEDFVEMVREKL